MKRSTPYLASLVAIAVMIPLPTLGLWMADRLAPHHLEFPPISRYVEHAPFSWLAFTLMAIAIATFCLPVVIRIVRHPVTHSRDIPPPSRRPFPWWGWAAILWIAAAWTVAWSRFGWASQIQSHTFFPLWFGYILVVNAMSYRRKGRCLLTSQPLRVLLLFFVSAAFWWYFEYLNRFVQNWFYFGVDTFSRSRYFWFATLSFSTVLPAVTATDELLATFPRLTSGLDRWRTLTTRRRRTVATIWLGLGIAALLAIGHAPDLLFPTLWLSPLVFLVACQTLSGAPTIFSPLQQGNWRPLVRVALSALICGFFWEMWNYRSEAGWIYEVPFVHRFKIFEMPVLGYAGYLPFGLECAVIAAMILKQAARRTGP